MSTEAAYPEARAVTAPPNHHFFGYYDKFPWDATGRYLLTLESTFIDRPPTGDDKVTVAMVDLEDGNRLIPLAETYAWNWQQGTHLQWLPTAPDRLIIYNSREGDHFAAVIQDVHSGEKRVLPRPIYAVSRDGKSAVSLDFARVADTRPGYGYVGLPDPGRDEPHPDDEGIYWLNLETGENRLIISLDQIVHIGHNETMDDSKHWVNHMQFNTDDSRFLFLHRWKRAERPWWTRLFTANPDGSEIRLIADHDMTSHFDWRDERYILAWARQHDLGDFYYLFDEQTNAREIVGRGVLTTDGHCSYSPDRQWILTDTYPDRERKRTLLLYRPADRRRIDIGRFYAPPELDGEIRCDLHPRWNRDGTQVCFDSVHEGHRQMYVIDVAHLVST